APPLLTQEGSLPLNSPLLPDDEARPAPERHVRPSPLQNDEKPILETREVINMDGEPHEPGNEAAEVQRTDFEDRLRPADRRHLALSTNRNGFRGRSFRSPIIACAR